MHQSKCLQKLFFVVLFFLFQIFCPIYGQTKISEEDSLKNAITSQSGEKKLSTLQQLMLLKLTSEDGLIYIDQLEKEAQKQNNEDYVGKALLMRTTYYMNTELTDSFLIHAERSKEYSIEHQNYDYYFAIESYVVGRYINEGNYELALFYANKMFKRAKDLDNTYGEINAYESIGHAYMSSRRPEEAIKPLLEGFELLKMHYPDDHVYLMEYAFKIIQTYYDAKNFDASILYCDWMKKEFALFESARQGTGLESLPIADYKMHNEVYYALNYIRKDQSDLAKEALKRATAHTMEGEMEEFNIQNLNVAYADYYCHIRNYKQALEYIDQADAFYKEFHIMSVYLEILDKKAEILAGMKQFEDAYQIKNEITRISDSLAIETLSKQISDLRIIHQVDKLEMESASKEIKYRNRLMLVVTIAVLSIIACLIILYFYRKKRIAFRELARKNTQWANSNALEVINFPENRKNTKKEEIVEDNNSNPSAEERELVNIIHNMMLNEKIFQDFTLTLESLSDRMKINRNILSKAINQCTGKNFNLFVNEYRIKEAVRIISDSKHKILYMDELVEKVGFNSKAPFYQAFKKITGFSPTEFRKNNQ